MSVLTINKEAFESNMKRHRRVRVTSILDSEAMRKLFVRYGWTPPDRTGDAIRACSRCSVSGRREWEPVPPAGSLEAPFVFIGRAPDKASARENSQVFAKSPIGRLFNSYLSSLSISRDEVYLTNAVHCPLGEDHRLSSTEVAQCALWKPVELAPLRKVKVLFLLGNDALRSFLGPEATSLLRNYGITYEWAPKFLWDSTVAVVPLIHMGSIIRDSSLASPVATHLAHVRKYVVDPLRA